MMRNRNTANTNNNNLRYPRSSGRSVQRGVELLNGGGTGTSFALIIGALGLVVAIAAAVGVGISSGLWVSNVHRLGDETDVNQVRLEELALEIQAINDSLPTGNGTIFFDDEWILANGLEPSRRFMLNASLIGIGSNRNYAFPDIDGIVALQQTLPPPQTMFDETEFAVTGDGDPKRIEFDLSLLPPSAFRLFRWPNKNGVLATLADVVAVAGNTSEFLDSEFAILNDPDITKRVVFNASRISTNTNQTYSFPDVSMTLVGRDTDSDTWSLGSLGMDGGAGTYNTIGLVAATENDRFFRFESGGSGGTPGRAGLTFNAFGNNSFSLCGESDGLKIYLNPTGPTVFDDLGSLLVSLDSTSGNMQLHNPMNSASFAAFDATNLTGVRDLTLPDVSGVLVLEDANQALSNKVMTDPSNVLRATSLGLNDSSSVDVTQSAPPEVGQVLTATSATTASWSGPPMPTGSILDYAGNTEPDGWLFCFGQAVSRTTFAGLFAVVSTTYGIGDGSTTFNLPDMRGRIVAGRDDMGGVSANRLTGSSGGVDGDGLGNAGGGEIHVLTESELASHNHNSPTRPSSDVTGSGGTAVGWAFNGPNGGSFAFAGQVSGGDGGHNNVQPTFILNKIIRV